MKMLRRGITGLPICELVPVGESTVELLRLFCTPYTGTGTQKTTSSENVKTVMIENVCVALKREAEANRSC